MRNIQFEVGQYYHIYNRGVDKRTIFTNTSDYLRFLESLYWFNDTKPHELRELKRCGNRGDWISVDYGDPISAHTRSEITEICAYCLMSNHFHLLLKESYEGGITKFMHKLSLGYTLYFNEKYKRSGCLFQGRFKAVAIKTDEQLKHVTRYIHLNPAELKEPKIKESRVYNKENLVKFLENYKWSSYQDFIGKRDKNYILNKKALPKWFNSFNEYKNFTEDWIDYYRSLITFDSLILE